MRLGGGQSGPVAPFSACMGFDRRKAVTSALGSIAAAISEGPSAFFAGDDRN